jgi:UDP-N-acetylmuramoyl-tripeptide--D-alanyl-D-alanine ligase
LAPLSHIEKPRQPEQRDRFAAHHLKLGAGYERAVLEMGFYVIGEIQFLCDIAQPQIGVLTNVGTVHAERAGSQEAISAAKANWSRRFPQMALPSSTLMIPGCAKWKRRPRRESSSMVFLPKRSVGRPDRRAWAWMASVFAALQRRDLAHAHPVIGRHSVHTALRAAAVGLNDGMNWQEILKAFTGHTQLRLVAVRSESGALILDDTYNAAPESMLAALNLLDEMDGRKIAVLG